jgi:cation diffusion facilitator family transporter
MTEKEKVARLSVISNTTLIVLKIGAGILSGSVSIISEAIHSSMDLIASLIALFSVKTSDIPSDKEHPYGHGKVENVSGVIESVLIFVAAVMIITEAIKRLINPGDIEAIAWGAGVMFIAATANWLVSRQLYKVAHETDSIALEADALHLKTDVYTSLGVAVGLSLIWITGITFLDPVIAIGVAMLILRESFIMMKKAFNPLIDSAWEDNEYNRLLCILTEMHVSFHDLKTRKAGKYRFVEFHIEMPENTKLKAVHLFCDSIEDRLKSEFSNLEVMIHQEPTPINKKKKDII